MLWGVSQAGFECAKKTITMKNKVFKDKDGEWCLTLGYYSARDTPDAKADIPYKMLSWQEAFDMAAKGELPKWWR